MQRQLPPVQIILLEVPYYDFDAKIKTGKIEVDETLAEEVREIFQEIFASRFPIASILPFHHFGNDDDRSMRENNCYGYGYREAVNKPGVLSWHSFGRAIDINPLFNPYIKGSMILPKEGEKFIDRSLSFPGMIYPDGPCTKAFEKRGWTWGGRWEDRIDYHHFEKPLN